ncbi:hypothetical protein RQP46_001648 [Phenoliferia psychrophenolica]
MAFVSASNLLARERLPPSDESDPTSSTSYHFSEIIERPLSIQGFFSEEEEGEEDPFRQDRDERDEMVAFWGPNAGRRALVPEPVAEVHSCSSTQPLQSLLNTF